jgi:tripartite-type tricarboxylate transporter receptor subunit TctC
MKKTILSLFLLTITSVAFSAEEVKVFWPFAAASPQATMIRAVLDNANTQQNKYKFIFTHSQGAGGAIAANAALRESGIALLASTSSFYIRPELYTNSHKPADFNIVSAICIGQPLGILSKNPKLLSDNSQEISLGIIPGSITSLVAITLTQNNPNIKVNMIPFKSSPESTINVMGGHIDGSVEFVGTLTTDKLGESMNVIGITGNINQGGYSTFSSIGVKGLENIVNDYFIFSPKTIDVNVQQDLHNIFNNAINKKVTDVCNDAYGIVEKKSYTDLQTLHKEKQDFWSKITEDIKKL